MEKKKIQTMNELSIEYPHLARSLTAGGAQNQWQIKRHSLNVDPDGVLSPLTRSFLN